MKRMISFIIVFVIVISASLNAFAGSIDVDIAYYDDARNHKTSRFRLFHFTAKNQA